MGGIETRPRALEEDLAPPPNPGQVSDYHRRASLHVRSRRTVLPTLNAAHLDSFAGNHDSTHSRRPVQRHARRLTPSILAFQARPLRKAVLDGRPVERDDDDDEHRVNGLSARVD